MSSASTNYAIAKMLNRYATVMEIAGENPFRVRAIHRGAESIEHLPDQVASMRDVDTELNGVPGIGSGILQLIHEILDAGTIANMEALADRAPIGLVDIVELPGIGAKTALKLYQTAQVSDLETLRMALATGKIAGAPGLGPKLSEKLVAGLAAIERRTGRHRIGTALPLARSLVASIRAQVTASDRIEIAGSLRRWQETIGNIDLITTIDADRMSGLLANLADIHNVVQDGTTVRARHERELDIRIFTAPERSFGTAFIEATGPTEHLAAIGFDRDIEVPSEEAYYEQIGLPWIAPEFRQGADELEFVRRGAIADVITLEDVAGELHCHTVWSDGHGTIREMAEAARAAGYTYLGISDHSHSLGVANGLNRERIQAQAIELGETAAALGFPLLRSSEVEVLRDGALDFDAATLDSLDAVIVSTHSGLTQLRPELMARVERALTGGHVDILAHPSGRLIEEREPGDFDWPAVYQLALSNRVALEINADPARLDLSAEHARQAIAAGCTLTINCDSHTTDGFEKLEYGIGIARRAFVPKDRVINTWPLQRLRTWLADPAGR
jgi:DNA polymerase (family 10)